MYIAQELKKNSIVEYLLYMWQVEDLIRAYGYSLKRIKLEYISQFNYNDEQKDEMTDWYGNLIRMMNEEGKRLGGHLQINQIISDDLNELHAHLLHSSKFPFYNAEYYKVLPYIVELRNKNRKGEERLVSEERIPITAIDGSQVKNEIETCLDALYGMMLLRLQKKEISQDTQHAMREITTFMGMLSDYYIKDKKEGLDFGDA